MSESVEVIADEPIKTYLRVFHVIHRMIVIVGRFIFSWYWSNGGERIPPIKEDILRKPAVELAQMIREKKTTSVEILEAFIRRIKDVNPALNCVVDNRFDQALKEAKEADDLVAGGTKTTEELAKEKPFLGVPFTTKDCIAVKGLLHTAGVVLRKDIRAEKDALAIHYLREAGAIPIALTNVPELCMWYESHNHIHGLTKNPYNTSRIVGGSSGGEACLQAAAGSAFGVGSDIGGSIRMPSFFCGIFGHKPSRYIVSTDGNYPKEQNELQKSFLGVGPMARHATDLKPLLAIVAGENSKKLDLDKPVDIANLKVYYQLSNKAPLVDPVDKEIVAAMHKVINFLSDKVTTKPLETKIRRLRKSNPLWLATMANHTTFAKLITGTDSNSNLVCEIIKNVFGHSANTMIGLFTALFEKMGVKEGSDEHKRYCKIRDETEKTFKDLLKDDGVWLYPTHPVPAPYHHEPLLRPFNFTYTAIVNCMGLPATHIPLGLNKEGLPIGIQVVANHDNDRLCLAVAELLEKEFGGWVEPVHKKKEE